MTECMFDNINIMLQQIQGKSNQGQIYNEHKIYCQRN